MRTRRQGARARLLPGLVAVVLTGSALVACDGSSPSPPPAAAPSAAPTPEPGPREALLPAADATAAPTAAGVQAALAGPLADPALGTAVSAVVVDVATGTSLLDLGGDGAVVPASTAKLLTAAAVLTGLPPDTRLTTRVVTGAAPGEVVLVGGGDATLAGPQAPRTEAGPARLDDLADRARAALAGAPVTRVLVDDTAYTGPALGPSWRPGYVSGGAVAPVSALQVDAGRVAPGRLERVPDPALSAGRAFAALLGLPAAAVVRAPAPPGARELAAVSSPPVAQLVEQTLTRSDNDLAEALAHRLAREQGLPASFAGAGQALASALSGLLAPGEAALVDGSGLSRDNRLRPAALVGLLARTAATASGGTPDRLAPLLTGLPVAGFDGTLERRYRAGPELPAAGQVRAKTGTLEGVSALAGLVSTADGRLLAFDLTLNAVPPGGTRAAEQALDRAAAALAACGCR